VLRRIVLLGLAAAAAVVAAGILAWRYHLDAVASLLDAQLVTARALLPTPSVRRDPAGLLTALGRPEINVIVRDGATGAVYNYLDGAVAAPPAGPPGAGPPGLPGEPPPGDAPPGLPGGPPPEPGGRRARFPMAIAALAHVPPRHAQSGDLTLTMLPSQTALARWFLLDVVTCGAALAAVGGAAWATAAALARAARRPLLRTTLALENLAAGDFTPQSVEAGDAPEIARLARAYNAAAETVARSIEERRAAAAEFQRFLADAGHELRTPLTIVGGYIDILGRATRDDDATGRRAIAGMTAETARMRALVEKMLLLSRLETSVASPRVVEVGPVSEEVAEAMRPGYPGRVISVACDAAARVLIDEDDLYEAQRNLVENALRYAPDSPVDVRAFARDGEVAIEVADRGPGIPAQEQAMVFERFYRGKDRIDSEGSGLGLAIVRRVVERWGGTVSLDSGAGGTRFVMRFPLAETGA
jgi:two-component system, OmpR family, sensor kinase